MIPRRAAMEIAPMTATGIAISNGQGVATTTTARNRRDSPLIAHAKPPSVSAIGVYQAPSLSPRRRMRGRRCSASCITRMILAYRESIANFSARICKTTSPFTAPDSTGVPGTFSISKGSPVRYDSSIFPRPSRTTPSTGQISCGKITIMSPIPISGSFTSIMSVPTFRCATCGIRFANLSRTEDARRLANSSRAVPPESMRITITPTRYSPRSTDVTMETPARWSDPNSRASSFRVSGTSKGTPPTTSARISGACDTTAGKPSA